MGERDGDMGWVGWGVCVYCMDGEGGGGEERENKENDREMKPQGAKKSFLSIILVSPLSPIA